MPELETDCVSNSNEVTPQEGDATLVDVSAAHCESNLEQTLDELDRELVGLRPVKSYIRQLASLLLVARLRE